MVTGGNINSITSHRKLLSIAYICFWKIPIFPLRNLWFFLIKKSKKQYAYLETMRNKTYQLTLYYEINHYILLSSIFLRLPDTLSYLIPIWGSSVMLCTRTVYSQGINFLKAIELLSAEAKTKTLIMVHHSVPAHGWIPHLELVRVLTGRGWSSAAYHLQHLRILLFNIWKILPVFYELVK